MRPSTPELIAVQLPQVLVMREASDGTQVGAVLPRVAARQSVSRPGEDAHHASMGPGRLSMTAAARPSSAGR